MPEPGWSAAATRVELPTPEGGPLAGYADRTGGAQGTLDPLEANLLLLDDRRGGRLLWIALDSVAIGAELRAAITTAVAAVTAVPTERMLCAASHSHATPAGWVGSIHPVLPAELDPAAIAAVAGTIAAAAARLEPRPVELSWAEGSVYGVGGNRHGPRGPSDPSTGVLLVGSISAPTAVLYDHACHPTVLGPDNRRWSADWVGAARTDLRAELAADLPVLFLQGCAGDQSTRFHRRGQTEGEVRRLGRRVAEGVLEPLPGARLPAGRLRVVRDAIRLPTRAPEPVPASRPRPAYDGDRLAASRAEGQRARQAVLAAEPPAELALPITSVQVAGRSWLHCSLEPYAVVGATLRAATPGLRVIGYTDGYHGYLADPAAYAEEHYEALSSYFDAEHGTVFVERCRSWLASLATRADQPS